VIMGGTLTTSFRASRSDEPGISRFRVCAKRRIPE
jgi:hypothetical protein